MSGQYRHEQKYICSFGQMMHLYEVMSAILPADAHQNGSYHIKSLYFDTEKNRFLQESLDGVSERSKYRLRRYDEEKEKIKFECKSSYFQLKQKRFDWLSKKEAENMLCSQDCENFLNRLLLKEFYCLKKTEKLSPKIIIDYDRTAFVHKGLNVRITLDQNITVSQKPEQFLNDNTYGKNILSDNAGILEVKFDDILPPYIVQVLGLEDLEQTAFSKYVMGRLVFNDIR